MAQEIEVKVKVITSEAVTNVDRVGTSFVNLKTQLRQAQIEVAALSEKFGATSREAINAAKRAGELKDKIGDAKALTDAFNPDAKFKSLSASLTGVAGGFSVVTGAMGAFGANTKDVEESLLKVQSAMAMASGAQAVGESVDSFKQLAAVVKSYTIVQRISAAVQTVWNIAMNANPIGAMVIAITALIGVGVTLVNYFKTATTTSTAYTQAVYKNSRALEESKAISEKHANALKKTSDYQYALARAAGASTEELRKLSIKQIEEEISLNSLSRTIAQNTYYRELNTLATYKANGASAESVKLQTELVKKSLDNFVAENKNLTKSLGDKKELIRKNNVEIVQEHTDHNNKLSENAQLEIDKGKEQQAKALSDLKEYNKQTLKEISDFNLAQISQKVEEDILEQERKAKSLEDISAMVNAMDEADLASEKATSDKKIEIAKAEAQQKTDIQNAEFALATGAINFLKEIGGKNKAIQKAAIIAENAVGIGKMIIANNAANVGALATPQAILTSGASAVPVIAMNNITTGLGIATTIASTAKALQALGGGAAGGAPALKGGGGGGISTPEAMPVNPQVVGDSGVNQLAKSLSQTPLKTYVVAKDVTTQQSLDRNITDTATLG